MIKEGKNKMRIKKKKLNPKEGKEKENIKGREISTNDRNKFKYITNQNKSDCFVKTHSQDTQVT